MCASLLARLGSVLYCMLLQLVLRLVTTEAQELVAYGVVRSLHTLAHPQLHVYTLQHMRYALRLVAAAASSPGTRPGLANLATSSSPVNYIPPFPHCRLRSST